jgi:hypothetical protein
MKRISWLLILLCGTVIFATSVPAADDPDTAYNEADSCVAVSLPLADATSLISPASASADIPRLSSTVQVFRPYQKLVTPNTIQPSHSLQQMLCTFLI